MTIISNFIYVSELADLQHSCDLSFYKTDMYKMKHVKFVFVSE